jgi:hypothetical protein
MANEIVFIQANKYLKSAISFDQFVKDENCLITMIGEYHMKEFSCKDPQISISDYAINRYNDNKNTRIFLEYQHGDGFDASNIQSIPIQELFKKFGNNIPIIPYDYRAWWIGYQNQLELYQGDLQNLNNYDKIYEIYVKPLYDKWNEGFNLTKQLYKEKEYNFLSKEYLKVIDSNFKSIVQKIQEKGDKDELVFMLKNGWKSVTDFYILKEILKSDTTVNENIIITGEAHRKNLSNILDKFLNYQLINQQINKPNECINLYNTYEINSLLEMEKDAIESLLNLN